MNVIERFDTASVVSSKRLDFWNEAVANIYDGIYVSSDSESFNGKMLRWVVGDLAMIRPRSEAATVERVPRGGHNDEQVVLHVQRRGTSRHRQRGRETHLHPGDFSLLSANEPYTLDLATEHELLVVQFPRTKLVARLPGLDDRLSSHISGRSPGGRLFHDFLLSLWLQGDQSHADPDWQQGVSNVFFDLLALAMRGSDATKWPGTGAVQSERILALIDARLGDAELGTAAIAEELGISVRTVQNVFAARGTTPSVHIQERRLDRATEQLMSHPDVSITTVAFDLGFNDSAYFTRCFRQKYGVSPSAWRGRLLEEGRPS
jgi:AraC-like DNA-binding protein